MKIGYARVSTDDQRLESQIDQLSAASCDRIFEDRESGAKADRPQLLAALDHLRTGDTLVVWRLDRLGRSLHDLVKIVGDLKERGVGFESLKEKIETVSASGKLTFHLFAALAEFERDMIRERTNAGLAAARARGRMGGRKPLEPAKLKMLHDLYADKSNTPTAICKTLGISRTTLYRHVNADKPHSAKDGNEDA